MNTTDNLRRKPETVAVSELTKNSQALKWLEQVNRGYQSSPRGRSASNRGRKATLSAVFKLRMRTRKGRTSNFVTYHSKEAYTLLDRLGVQHSRSSLTTLESPTIVQVVQTIDADGKVHASTAPI